VKLQSVAALALPLLVGLAACTPGASAPPSGGGMTPAGAQVTTIDVNLTLDPAANVPAGTARGFKPLAASIARGTYVRFQNSDGFAHTATSIAGTTFPSAYPFTNAALTARGSTLSAGFSSGNLTAGAISAPILADIAGRYIYGCFYHYGTPMRAEIDVQ
jgi:plastocyanin